MVRPKASEKNLEIAREFANAITVKRSSGEEKTKTGHVGCKGSNSVFAALRYCLPRLTRLQTEKIHLHRNAVSEIELNKCLTQTGFISHRQRRRILGTYRWSKGHLRWKNIRWIDPGVPEDLETLHFRLVELIYRYPSISYLHHDTVISFLASACSAQDHEEADGRPDRSSSTLESAESLACPFVAENCHQNIVQPLRTTWLFAPKRFVQLSTGVS